MGKQSVNFTTPNEHWLNAKVQSEEYSSKTEIVNDLIRREREREEKRLTLKAAIEHGLASGISDNTAEDIRNNVLSRLRKDGQLPTD